MTTTSSAKIIDGKALAQQYRSDLTQAVKTLNARGKIVSLDAVMADPGADSARSSAYIYADNQKTTCEMHGIEYRLHILPAGTGYAELAGRILLLGSDPTCTAIMLHLPVPDDVDTYKLQSLINPAKDVEGVNPANIGNIVYGRSSLVPCTALAVLNMIESTGIKLPGARVVCVGASDIVGKPVAVLMMQREATVISCNIHTKNISELTQSADVLIVAVGKPNLITGNMVKDGAIVIDVGVNRITDPDTGKKKITGDVNYDEVCKVAAYISPVPGGVGPMTVAMLLQNTLMAAANNPTPV